MTTGNFLDILILFGSIQGFISAFILFTKKRNASNRLLGAILLLISLACVNIYLFHVLRGELHLILHILERVIPLIIIMPLGPLIYFYTRSYLGKPFLLKNVRLHFVPVILDLVPSIVSLVGIFLYLSGFSENIESTSLIVFKDSYEKYVDAPRWISLTIYIGLAARFLFVQQTGNKKKVWLKQFLLAFVIFQVLWMFHLVPYLVPATSNWLLETLSWYPVYLPLTLLVYWLGINGMIQSRSSTTGVIDEEEYKKTVASLDQIMIKEQLFLNSLLSLNDLVERSGVDQKTISAALNQYMGKSFNEYVNTYRVAEVKQKLVDDSYNHLSITGVALESGFNSQATFLRAFKAVTRMTPKAYREHNRATK